MNKNTMISAAAATLALCATGAFADEWQIVGPRALGMGGAYTAVAVGPAAQYWNPAGLSQGVNKSGLDISATGRVELTGNAMEVASKLSKMQDQYKSLQQAQQTGGKLNANTFAAMVDSINQMNQLNQNASGAVASANGGASLKIKNFVIGLSNYTQIGATPFVDLTNIGLGAFPGGSGVTLGSIATPAAQYQAYATSITNSLNTAFGGNASTMYNLICGNSSCPTSTLSPATASTFADLANALVNQSVALGASTQQMADYANQIAANADAAAPVISAASGSNPYANNQTRLNMEGGSFTELGVSYARSVLTDNLHVGLTGKIIQGKIGYYKVSALSDNASSIDALKDYNKYSKTSVQPGLDLGVLYQFPTPSRPRFGLVVRNINSPSFDRTDQAKADGKSDKYKLDGQARAGFAINPMNWWTLAADLDLSRNATSVSGYSSRQFALGTEINLVNHKLFNIPLRVGIMKNVDKGSDVAYTAGTGINMLTFHVELAGMISSKRSQFDGKDFPTEAGASASVGFLF